MKYNILQVYVVARVEKDYRSLGTVLARVRSDLHAVETCLHLLQIYSCLGNRACLSQELRLAGVDVAPSWGTPKGSPVSIRRRHILNKSFFPNSHVDEVDSDSAPPARPTSTELYNQFQNPCPFPFITTCLLVGTTFRPGSGDIDVVSEQPYGIAFDQTMNRGTLLVLDITDLASCRYGFVYVPWLEDDADNAELGQPHYKALAADEYLDSQAQVTGCHAYDLGQSKEWVDSMLGQTGRFSVLPPGCLASLWPFHEAWVSSPETEPPPQRSASSLKAIAFGRVVDTFLTSSHDVMLLSEITKLPDFSACLRACLESRADAVAANPAAACELLQLAFSAEQHVDLSPYFGLTIDHIVAILRMKAVAASIDTLSIAAGTITSPEEFMRLSGALPLHGITSFYLMELPRRQGDTFDPIKAYHIMRTKVRDKIILGSVLSHSVQKIPWLNDTEAPIGLSDMGRVSSDQGMLRQLLFQNIDSPEMEKPWIDIVQLGDATLSPMRLIAGLIRLLHQRLKFPSRAPTCLSYALFFATAPASLDYRSSPEIIGLPTETYAQTLGTEPQPSTTSWTRLRQLKAHEWTIVVDCIDARDSHEAVDPSLPFLELRSKEFSPSMGTFQVAFIRPIGATSIASASTLPSSLPAALPPGAFEALSLEGYLKRYAGSDFHPEDLEAALQRLKNERNPSTQRRPVAHASVLDNTETPTSHGLNLDRPILSHMSTTRACEIFSKAAIQDQEAEAEYAARATRSTCTRHRACTCQGKKYRI